MKKFRGLLLVGILVFMFAGCGKLTEESFVGTWTNNTQNTKDEWIFHTGNVLERNKANNFASIYNTGTYKYDDGKIIVVFDNQKNDSFTYTVEYKKDKTLKMTLDGDTIEYTFQK